MYILETNLTGIEENDKVLLDNEKRQTHSWTSVLYNSQWLVAIRPKMKTRLPEETLPSVSATIDMCPPSLTYHVISTCIQEIKIYITLLIHF